MVGLLVCFLLLAFSWPVFAADLVINEFVSAPSAVNPEWVELFNASDSAEYLKSYFLDDDTSFDSDSGSSAKKILTNLNISNPHYPFFVFTSSILNNDGDSIVLFDPSGALVDQFTYYDNPGSDMSIGRSPNQTGQFSLLVSLTQGQPNEGAVPSPTPSPTHAPTSTPTPTPAHTSTPTPTPAKTPTPTPAKTPTPTTRVSPTLEATLSGVIAVLGVSDPPATASAPAQTRPYIPAIISLSLVGSGLGILSLALVWQKRNAILE